MCDSLRCYGFLQQAFHYGRVEFYNVEACECVPVFFLYVSEPLYYQCRASPLVDRCGSSHGVIESVQNYLADESRLTFCGVDESAR